MIDTYLDHTEIMATRVLLYSNSKISASHSNRQTPCFYDCMHDTCRVTNDIEPGRDG